MPETISLSDIIPASPERVYTAWLDAEQHGAMTGSTATDEGDGRFTAWDAYISGRTVSRVPHSKIVQAWRTTEFPPDHPDSVLTIQFDAVDGGTRVSITQENVPAGQGDSYEKGWDEFYFTPMKKYFGGSPMDRVKESVGEALDEARHIGEATVKAVKKAQKQAARTIKKVSKQVGKQARALVAKAKKAAQQVGPKKKKKVAAKKTTKKAAPARSKKKSPGGKKRKK